MMREGLGSERIDSLAHLNNLAIIEAVTDVYGLPAPTASLSDIDEADAILVLDSNIINTHPVAALDLLLVHRSGAAKVFVAGHRSNKLTTQCAQFARTQPGSEVALLNCLAGLMIEKGALNESVSKDLGEDYDKLKVHLAGYSLETASGMTGVDADIISEIAAAIGEAKNFLLVLSPGSLHSAVNSSVARAAINLAVLKNGKVLSLLREGNAQGALDMGVSPDFLPGYKEAVSPQSSSLGVSDIFHAIEAGEVKALYLMGGDIRKELSLLGLSLEILQSLECLIVQDVFGGPVAEMAHIVLPASSFAEHDATYTNAYRIVQHNAAALETLGQCRPDEGILNSLSHGLGLPQIDSVDAVRDQIASSVRMYDFMQEAPQPAGDGAWDYSRAAPGVKPRLSEVKEGQATVDEAFPYILTFDNALHYGGASSLHSGSLAKIRPDGIVEVSKDDANALGLENGTTVELKVKDGGSVKAPVQISGELPPGILSVPAHSHELIQSLISKLEPSTLKAEEGAPVWVAGLSVAKD